MDRPADTDRFSVLLARLGRRLGGTPQLQGPVHARLPEHGMYFFFRPEEATATT